MGNTNKYLDYDGLQTYHNELVKRLTDLEYDPTRVFDSKIDLFNRDKWGANKYGRVIGLKEGLIVSVGTEIWQLINPSVWNDVLSRVQSAEEKSTKTPVELGWKIIGSGTSFKINGHILQLVK